jgi:hypothetical protein
MAAEPARLATAARPANTDDGGEIQAKPTEGEE